MHITRAEEKKRGTAWKRGTLLHIGFKRSNFNTSVFKVNLRRIVKAVTNFAAKWEKLTSLVARVYVCMWVRLKLLPHSKPQKSRRKVFRSPSLTVLKKSALSVLLGFSQRTYHDQPFLLCRRWWGAQNPTKTYKRRKTTKHGEGRKWSVNKKGKRNERKTYLIHQGTIRFRHIGDRDYRLPRDISTNFGALSLSFSHPLTSVWKL